MTIRIVLSVDWEKDSGAWRRPDREVDYGGVLVGTPVLSDMLDRLAVPCTWLVECHGGEPRHNLPSTAPELVSALDRRGRDEVGVHIHWARRADTGRWSYPTEDRAWTTALIGDSVRDMTALGITPRSFRGGAFLKVDGLSRALKANGFSVDSTSFRGLAGTYPPTALHRIQTRAALLTPFMLRPRRTGGITHLPVAANVFSTTASEWLSRWLTLVTRTKLVTTVVLYMHIHQLTRPESPADGAALVDHQAARTLEAYLARLAGSGDVEFRTMRDAAESLFPAATVARQ